MTRSAAAEATHTEIALSAAVPSDRHTGLIPAIVEALRPGSGHDNRFIYGELVERLAIAGFHS